MTWPRAVPLGAQRRAGGERNAAADNAGGAEIAIGRIEDVQDAAAAETVAGAASHDLGHQAPDIGAFGETMAVAAMIAGDHVVAAQQRAHADRHRFLPGAQMHQPGDDARGRKIAHLFFEAADQLHRAQQPQAFLGRGRRRNRRCGRRLRR